MLSIRHDSFPLTSIRHAGSLIARDLNIGQLGPAGWVKNVSIRSNRHAGSRFARELKYIVHLGYAGWVENVVAIGHIYKKASDVFTHNCEYGKL